MLFLLSPCKVTNKLSFSKKLLQISIFVDYVPVRTQAWGGGPSHPPFNSALPLISSSKRVVSAGGFSFTNFGFIPYEDITQNFAVLNCVIVTSKLVIKVKNEIEYDFFVG